MSFSVTGTVIEVGPVEQISDSFRKRILVVKYAENPQYPEEVQFEAHQDRVSLFDNIYAGDEVEVSWNLRGKKWTSPQGEDKWFNTLVCWRVNKTGQAASTPPPTSGMTREAQQQAEAKANAPKAQAPSFDDGEDDSLPF